MSASPQGREGHEATGTLVALAPAKVNLGLFLGALDIHAAVVSKWSGARKHLEAQRPELYAALMRVEAHPKVAAVFAEHWPKT